MNKSGYTLLELLLSIALLGMIAGFSVPVSYTFVSKNNLAIAETAAVHSMRRAMTLATASEGFTTWGVYIETGSITVFRGSSYAARDTDYDEIISIGPGITPSGFTEVVFSRITGFPTTTGTLTLTTSNNLTETITVNDYGTLDY